MSQLGETMFSSHNGLMHGEFFNQGDADSAENMTTEYHIV
jgi:hypothetical protein